jgi:toxin CcdB
MARFDVYTHPDAKQRRITPFLLDVQNTFLDQLSTRVVVPLRTQSGLPVPVRDLNPVLDVAGKSVVMDTAALAAFPAADLKLPVCSFKAQPDAVLHALDALFGGY